MIRSYRGRWPHIAASAYIDPAATIIGDVTIGEQSSVWPGVVIRGDVHWIRIGARTNIQDGSVLHVMKDEYPLTIGDDVTVGHGVILHGCTIESRVLIGMGSILLNNVPHRPGLDHRRRHAGARRHRRPAGQPVHGPSGQIPPRPHGRGSRQHRRLRRRATSNTPKRIATSLLAPSAPAQS